MLFGKNKANAAPVSRPAPAPAPAAQSAKMVVDPNDFFSDIDRKSAVKKKSAAAVSADVAIPEVTGLREAPLPAPECTIDNLSTGTLSTDGLVDKMANYDGAYHGNMSDIDETAISFESLRDPVEVPAETDPAE